MTITGLVVLLLPAFVGAVSAAVLFQIVDRWRERQAHKQPAHKRRAVAA